MCILIIEETPSYLSDLLPNTEEDRSGYTLRNSNNYTIPFARLSSFQSSFFPSTLRLWNGLRNDVRSSQTVPQFKRKVRRHEFQVMDHLLVGDRKSNILLTRIRHRCSSLTFLECRLFYAQRQKNNLNPDFELNFDLLTSGTENCNTKIIFSRI